MDQAWTTTESAVVYPRPWLPLMIGSIVSSASVVVSIAVPTPEVEEWEPLFRSILAAGGLLGLLGTAIFAYRIKHLAPFRQATADSFPEIPHGPLHPDQQQPVGRLRYLLTETTEEISLEVDRQRLHKERLLLSLSPIILLIIPLIVVFLAPIELVFQLLLVAVGLMISGFISLVMFALYRQSEEVHGSLIFDRIQGKCYLSRKADSLSIPYEQLAAIQICAVHHIDSSGGSCDHLEFNIVWRDDSGFKRWLLMKSDILVCNPLSLVCDLAEKLNLPVVNHADGQHWKEEYQRSKTMRANEAS